MPPATVRNWSFVVVPNPTEPSDRITPPPLSEVVPPSVSPLAVAPVAKSIPPEPETACPRAVRTPVPVVVVEGADPDPPPIISAFSARVAEEVHDAAPEK